MQQSLNMCNILYIYVLLYEIKQATMANKWSIMIAVINQSIINIHSYTAALIYNLPHPMF